MNTSTYPVREVRPLVLREHRVYTGTRAELGRVRADLAHDLSGFDPDLITTLQLCLTELFTNTLKYTDSGTEHGEVLRTLSMPDRSNVCLSVSDSGGGGGIPRIPVERSSGEWAWAEGRRGLLLLDSLATTWGHHGFAPWADLGTNVWVTFPVDPATVPPDLGPYVFTH